MQASSFFPCMLHNRAAQALQQRLMHRRLHCLLPKAWQCSWPLMHTFPKKGIAPHKWPGFAAGFAKRLRHVPESCDLSSYNCTQNSVQYALIIVVSFCLDCSS